MTMRLGLLVMVAFPVAWATPQFGFGPPASTSGSATSSATSSSSSTRTSSSLARTSLTTSRPSTSATRTSTPTTALSSTSCQPVQTVQVNPGASHSYFPYEIHACVGDVITFIFQPGNHSVAKADFMTPCAPSAENEFFSGSFGNDKFSAGIDNNGYGLPPLPSWNLTVNDTMPTFFYCTAIHSCLQNGMVGVINPNATFTFKAQQAATKNFPYMQVPGQQIPAEGFREGFSDNGPSPSDGSHGLSGGAIAGIVIGALVVLAIMVTFFFVLGRNRVYKKWVSSQDGREDRTRAWTNSIPGLGRWSANKSDVASTQPDTSMVSPEPTQRSFSPPVQESHGYNSIYGPPSGQRDQDTSQRYVLPQELSTGVRLTNPAELDATRRTSDS